MKAELVRYAAREVDVKVLTGERMHVLQWRRRAFYDELLLDGKSQATSYGLWGREKVYGLVFGRDEEGEGGVQVMFVIDPRIDHSNWLSSQQNISGLRLDTSDGPLLVYGSLDPKTLERPATFADWMKKTMGMEW